MPQKNYRMRPILRQQYSNVEKVERLGGYYDGVYKLHFAALQRMPDKICGFNLSNEAKNDLLIHYRTELVSRHGLRYYLWARTDKGTFTLDLLVDMPDHSTVVAFRTVRAHECIDTRPYTMRYKQSLKDLQLTKRCRISRAVPSNIRSWRSFGTDKRGSMAPRY